MNRVFSPERIGKTKNDIVFLVVLFMLIGLGLCALLSASHTTSENLFQNSSKIIVKQIISALIAFILCIVVSRIPFEWIRKSIPLIVAAALVLCVVVLILGKKVKGGQRWLDLPFIGLTFQPSELVKLAIILYLSSLIEKKGDKITSFARGFLPLSIIVVLFSGLVLMQNDLSSAVLIFIIGMIIMFAAGVNIFAWIGQFVFFAGMSILTVFVIVPEKSDRIKAFFNPEAYQNDSAYQAIKSVEAISNGGFWGKGFGAGTLKYNIPEIHNDSIFAAVAEDVGFIGVFFVILLFVIFGYKGFQTVILNKDEKIKYLISIGITSSIMIQLCMNLAVVANLIPTTGVPLPFFSAGGSSLLVTLLMCGILINISRGENSASVRRGY